VVNRTAPVDRTGPPPVLIRTMAHEQGDGPVTRVRSGELTVVAIDPKDLAPLVAPNTHALRRPLARLGRELDRRRRQLQGDDGGRAVPVRAPFGPAATPGVERKERTHERLAVERRTA
jgi:hypothetical protein